MDCAELSIRTEASLQKLAMAATAVQAGIGYTVLQIPKRGGGSRTIHKALPIIGSQQSAVMNVLSDLYVPPACVHGYVKERGTYTNALPHVGREVVLRIDLQNFFASVDRVRLNDTLEHHGFDQPTSKLVMDLSCVDDRLAAGFSTGPILSNLAFLKTDEQLTQLAHSLGLNFSRYADDLTFSGSQISNDMFTEIREMLELNGWAVNDRKTRFMRTGGPQYVTGLYVGLPSGPRVPRRMKRRLRQQLHYLSIHGYSDCHQHVPWTLGRRQARGWVNYVSHVEPELGKQLQEVLDTVDFDLPRRIGFDDDWDALLDELGVPEHL